VLEVTFDSRYALLIGVTGTLIASTVVSYYDNVIGSPHLPLIAAFSAFPGTLDGGLGGCGLATISGCFRVA
jgi:hypothetical protein